MSNFRPAWFIELKGAYTVIFSALLNSSFIQYCDSNIVLFCIASHIVIALPTIATAIVGRAKTIERAIEKKSHKQRSKIETTN